MKILLHLNYINFNLYMNSNKYIFENIIYQLNQLDGDNFSLDNKKYIKIIEELKNYSANINLEKKLNYIQSDIINNRGQFHKSELLNITNDMLFQLTADFSNKNNVLISKLIETRFNNANFELLLAEMIVGDNPNFPYKSSKYITEFFNALGYPYTHDGSTRKYWVQNILKKFTTKELYENIICKGLFNKIYYIEYCKACNIKEIDIFINNAKTEFKNLLDNSYNKYNLIDISDCFDLNINTELLFNNITLTEDEILNDLIETSKKYFIGGDKKVAVEKLWDAFERIKSFYDIKNKKLSSDKLIAKISNNITQDDFLYEFKQLTNIGNQYQIRHHEINKIPINDTDTLIYLFFRMFSLLNLCITKIKQ